MIPNDQPLRKQTIQRMITKLIYDFKDDGYYTEWEMEFVDSIARQFEARGDLSQKQTEILERIYDK